ncbi:MULTISPECIES: MarR family winged helix-turn-helix transcriptional regulator [Apilactobacillus]|uniref:Putative transcriptional regulator (MarR family) n=1 Tax=Apilactobacillus kunkeei EFB6 TaxID=1419324 RepID=A0A836YWV3_9LACO|nr:MULTISPECIES: MarR family winged helix-turn-helix transcriptional regulator [Apilactobacillus]KDB01187.1 putative transcriptional regulator (MarR family) [Apilactobacillus kunkeei EFB6]MDN2612608.1 MarR family transcriptional regulator [Apilactobacillus sp. EABW-1NA]
MTENIGRQLKIASTQLTKKFDKFAIQYDLTSMQMSVIDFLTLFYDQEMFQKDIEHEFNIRRSTASTLLKRMEDKGLVRRVESNKDARQKQVILTDLAVQYEDDIQKFMVETQQQIHSFLSDEEYDALESSLDKIIKHMGD